MGKKSKGGKKQKTRRGDDEDEDDEYMPDLNETSSETVGDSARKANTTDKVGRDEAAIDQFLDGIEDLDNKKMISRLRGLKSIIDSLQSGVDMFDRISSNMDTLVDQLQRFVSGRSSTTEALLAMKILSILALVAGAENDDFADRFTNPLVNLATKSSADESELRIAAVRTLAFIHYVCSGSQGGYTCFGVIGDIAMQQSEGTEACSELQVAAAEAWCLLANTMEPQQVCDVCKEEDLFVELVGLLGSTNTETKIIAGQCLAMLWEVADKIQPDVDATVSAGLICDDEDKVREALDALKQIGRESSKSISKKDRKERKNALKSVSDWILDGVPPERDTVRLQGGDVELTTFGEVRVMDCLRRVLQSGIQTCMRVYPVTREILGTEYTPPNEHRIGKVVNEAQAGGGMTCDAFDKRFVRSQVGKVQKTHRRNQRADKEMMQAGLHED